jgi:hypothetical protein
LKNNEYHTAETDELTLRDLIARLREYGTEIRRQWRIMLLFCLPFLCWQGYTYLHTPTRYAAGLTFMVNEDEGGRLSGITGLLGSFGMAAGGENNFDRILELAKSMRIMREVLLTPIEINGQKDYIANHLIRIENVQQEKWSKKSIGGEEPALKNFLFTKHQVDSFNRLEQSALKSLYGIVLGGEKERGLFGTQLNQDAGIMSLSLSTRSEELSIKMLEQIFNTLSAFYIAKTIEKNKMTYEIVQTKADSIRALLSGTEYRQATFEDRSHSLLSQTDKVPMQRFSRDKQMLLLMYGEAIKNLEVADFALQSKTPYIQAIDMPFPPIKATPPSKKTALLLGLGLGLLVGGLWVVGRKMVREV